MPSVSDLHSSAATHARPVGRRGTGLCARLAMAAFAVACGDSLEAQRVDILTVPAWRSTGSLTGVVTGVNPATHRVAIYIYIDGAGWWSKPNASTPSVPIQPNGSFSANVYTCCLDDRASIFCAALIPASATAPVASGSCSIPANLPAIARDYVDRPGRTVQFAGRTWAVKEAPTPVGPGPNRFTDEAADVFVDAQRRLHLRVVARNGVWYSSEVTLMEDTGYGTYWFTTESQVGQLDANVVFGAFTWDPHCDDTTIPAWPNREIDFEDSRWGNGNDATSSQVVVQPFQQAGNLLRYTTPLLQPLPTLTRFFHWTPNRIDFRAAAGRLSPGSFASATPIHASTYVHNPATGRRVPPSGRQRFRFNLWVNQGTTPANGQMAEVIISDFRYSPAVGAFLGGCGVNPAGSARLLGGQPNLGSTITLGFDNPVGSQSAGSLAAMLLGTRTARFPCGLLQFGFGMQTTVGELLVDPNTQPIGILGGPWAGPGQPAPFSLGIPNDPGLVGQCVNAQGLIIDPVGVQTFGLADAFELCIQP